MKVGDRVLVWKQATGETQELDGIATVRELMYGNEWKDGGKAEVEFDDEFGKTRTRQIWDKDRIPNMQERVGTTVQIMCSGHVVDAKIHNLVEVYPGSDEGDPPVHEYKCEFLRHHETGDTTLCRDYWQNWYIRAGEMFQAGEAQIDRAKYWMEKHPITANQIATQIRANIREWFSDNIDHALFKERASGLWDKARELGLDDAVLEIVCPKGR
jgi:hypothetical protein